MVYTIAVLLPAAYLIGLIFTLKTHSHIYDIHISDGHGVHVQGQYEQEGPSTHHSNGEATSGHLLAANTCINASIVATSHIAAGVCGLHVACVCLWSTDCLLPASLTCLCTSVTGGQPVTWCG